MVARFTGGILGLLAFGVATLAGVSAGNPADVVLKRSLSALVLFCVIGLAIGAAAQAVIDEYMARKEKELFPKARVSEGEGDEVSGVESPVKTAAGS